MSGTPNFKVYRGKEYVAACHYAEDAAAVVALSGGQIRHGHRFVLFTDGETVDGEVIRADESLDAVAAVVYARLRAATGGRAVTR